MRWIRIGAAAVNQTPLDWSGNRVRLIRIVEEARLAGVQFLCLPELALSGYGCEDAFHGLAHSARAMESLLEFAPATKGMVVAVGVPVRMHHGLYNCVCLIAGGKILGISAKQNLAGDGIHYEPRWFRPWPAGECTKVEIGGKEVPFGDLVFDVGGIRIGAEICEDAWVPTRPGLRMSRAGCDVIINPSASHFAFGKTKQRERIVTEASRALGTAYVYSNLLGNEAGRVIYDGELLIASNGEIVARGNRFSFSDHQSTSAIIDVDMIRMRRTRQTSFYTSDAGIHIVEADWNWKITHDPPTPPATQPHGWAGGEHVKEEEFCRAVALGLFDYLRKSGSRGFVVSLSGGADSTAVATLVALAYQFARMELSAEEVQARLPRLKLDRRSFCGGLLETAYQASPNSSETTRKAAEDVAKALGAGHHEWNIGKLVEEYTSQVEMAIGEELTWDKHDIAMQNIQARVRAPGIWMLANVRGSLLLATSNRSEAAVGYATMDGDTAGGLSPIAGIDKYFLRKWLRWMGTEGPEGIGAVDAVMSVLEIPPTAELRPAHHKQTDEADLMPYDLLDAIERLAIRDHMSPREVFENLVHEWANKVGGEANLGDYIRKFYRLWVRNQWKRERYAPSFHLDDANLDPKTWCRFPILSGGYEEDFLQLPGAPNS
ncbi:NAD(+) synthase [bacterium]|nr:NAD(+) synthase [bacterium]